jgi:hypothetical protein
MLAARSSPNEAIDEIANRPHVGVPTVYRQSGRCLPPAPSRPQGCKPADDVVQTPPSQGFNRPLLVSVSRFTDLSGYGGCGCGGTCGVTARPHVDLRPARIQHLSAVRGRLLHCWWSCDIPNCGIRRCCLVRLCLGPLSDHTSCAMMNDPHVYERLAPVHLGPHPWRGNALPPGVKWSQVQSCQPDTVSPTLSARHCQPDQKHSAMSWYLVELVLENATVDPSSQRLPAGARKSFRFRHLPPTPRPRM